MAWGLPLAMIASAGLSGYFGSKRQGGQTVSQGPMYTPEQQEAMQLLLGFGKRGRYRGYTAGESYGGPLGAYDMTDIERGGQDRLMDLLKSPIGDVEYGTMGMDQLKKLFEGDKFDPYSEKGLYKGYKKQALREGKEAQDRLKRGMAVTGDLYSTATGKESGLLEERTSENLQNTLAELYDRYAGRQYGAIPWALQGEQAKAQFGLQERGQREGMEMGRIGASQQYGGLQRMLEDLKAKDMYAEWVRSREESKDPLKVLQGLAGQNTPFGATDVTVPGAYGTSPWQQVFSQLTGIAGNAWMQQLMGGQGGGYGGGYANQPGYQENINQFQYLGN